MKYNDCCDFLIDTKDINYKTKWLSLIMSMT